MMPIKDEKDLPPPLEGKSQPSSPYGSPLRPCNRESEGGKSGSSGGSQRGSQGGAYEERPPPKGATGHRIVETIPLNEDLFPPGLNIVGSVLGYRGSNQRNFERKSGAIVYLRGGGISGTRVDDRGKELEPLHLVVKCDRLDQVDVVRQELDALLDGFYADRNMERPPHKRLTNQPARAVRSPPPPTVQHFLFNLHNLCHAKGDVHKGFAVPVRGLPEVYGGYFRHEFPIHIFLRVEPPNNVAASLERLPHVVHLFEDNNGGVMMGPVHPPTISFAEFCAIDEKYRADLQAGIIPPRSPTVTNAVPFAPPSPSHPHPPLPIHTHNMASPPHPGVMPPVHPSATGYGYPIPAHAHQPPPPPMQHTHNGAYPPPPPPPPNHFAPLPFAPHMSPFTHEVAAHHTAFRASPPPGLSPPTMKRGPPSESGSGAEVDGCGVVVGGGEYHGPPGAKRYRGGLGGMGGGPPALRDLLMQIHRLLMHFGGPDGPGVAMVALPCLYQERFGMPLDLSVSGEPSLLSLLTRFPKVVSLCEGAEGGLCVRPCRAPQFPDSQPSSSLTATHTSSPQQAQLEALLKHIATAKAAQGGVGVGAASPLAPGADEGVGVGALLSAAEMLFKLSGHQRQGGNPSAKLEGATTSSSSSGGEGQGGPGAGSGTTGIGSSGGGVGPPKKHSFGGNEAVVKRERERERDQPREPIAFQRERSRDLKEVLAILNLLK
ncbi:unnamed protein product [Vitrella brassicaformis CCMP3155]|uniref:HTH OST-type domain-containing protein n=1 Tax=Vitrella brassicaformis (strain CCMP3155) TaxID=1169540 RepID=A0A0G4G8F1_VITBC|nr:unnamed protein product [Vitrella brassicaformis CCMP3155]|eukprot:CEM25110.1 unnamed protein product [Vitrella brassicaformis CCMP3155]